MPVASQLTLEYDYLLSMTEQSSQAVIITDHQGLIQTANHSFSEIIQVDEEDLIGQSITNLFITPFSIQFDQTLPTQLQGKLLCSGNVTVKTDVKVVTGNDGLNTYHKLTFYPKSSYEHLKQKLFEQIGVGLWLQDEQDRILEMNAIACQYLGIEASTVLYRSVNHFLKRLDHTQPHCDKLSSWLRDRCLQPDPIEFQWQGRSFRLVQIPTEDKIIGFRGFFYVLENKTEVQSLSQQVWTNNRLATIGQIAAGTAHEIRNPLTSIRGFLQVIGHRLKENGQNQEQGYIDIMLKEINRINHLVGEFLLLSKPRDVQLQSVSLEDVLKDILPIIESEALYRNVQIVTDNRCITFPKITADGELLKQVFLNLCKNGIEAMVDGGQLTIHLQKDEQTQQAVIEISDQGAGIPEWIVSKIFDPFFTTKEHGTGLGLPICKQILREIHGDITVESSSLGTRFRVFLPMD